MPTKIAFITYETPYAPCGGIAAVMRHIPVHLKKMAETDTIVITPFHHRIERTNSLAVTHVGDLTVRYYGHDIGVEILRHDDENGMSWYFLRPSDLQFFAGFPNPYAVGATQEEIRANLLRDSLFFGVAVAKSLHIIDPDVHWIMLMQDWEAATSVLAIGGWNSPYSLFLTLHNSYDSGPVSVDKLWGMMIDPETCPHPDEESTILERVIPVVKKPVLTVSKQFANDFLEDTLQTGVMADHLQNLLRDNVYGVDNGPFTKLAVSEEALTEANNGNYSSLTEWKQNQRAKALEAMNLLTPDEEKPVWGELTEFKKDDAPWFVLAGRDDTRQKGYDVAASAISRFLEAGGNARFLFFPIPGDEGLDGLNFLKSLAERYSESVIVFPFRWTEGFLETLRGATYGVMPSLYEPFGMANEFYLNGTVGIARATGGLVQQIVPVRSMESFSQSVQWRSNRWHSASAEPTGILYRERDDIESAMGDWKGINGCGYDIGGGPHNRVGEREQYALFTYMVDELRTSIVDGTQIYQDNPKLYYKMLTEGILHIQRSFSWEQAANEYVQKIQ